MKSNQTKHKINLSFFLNDAFLNIEYIREVVYFYHENIYKHFSSTNNLKNISIVTFLKKHNILSLIIFQ